MKGPTGCRYLADDRQLTYVKGGWNYTGDAYLVDADGDFVYQARTDDMIVSAGYNIAGPEVEGALLLHPAVAECGVVGVAGRRARADRQGVRRAEAGDRGGCARRRASCRITSSGPSRPYKYPRAVEYLAALPRTETGKLQRAKLRQAGDADAARIGGTGARGAGAR